MTSRRKSWSFLDGLKGSRPTAYVILNPTDAGITEDSTQWPGLFSRIEDAGARRMQRFHEPKVIRREDPLLR